MKAIVYYKYGSPDVLKLEEVQRPTPRDDEVLVKVHAASVNSWDFDLLRGTPFLTRIWGIRKPKNKILNQYQGGICISGVLKTTERTLQHLILLLGPNWVPTDNAVWRYVHFTLALV